MPDKKNSVMIYPEFDIGETVYLKVSVGTEHELPGVVVRWNVDPPPNPITYGVTWADNTYTSHYDFELTTDKFLPSEDDKDD